MKTPVADSETTFGQRLTLALSELEGHTELSQRDIEATLRRRGVIGEGSGYIARYKKSTVPNPEVIEVLAEMLHVRRDWLMYGEPPIRRDGRVEATPFEAAAVFCRQVGAREDAIKGAWARHKDLEATLTVFEWVGLIGDEQLRLEKANVPRPEVVTKYETDVRKTRKRKQQGEDPKPDSAPGERIAGERSHRSA